MKKSKSRAYQAFNHVVVLTNTEVHARRDVESMKSFDPKAIKVFTTGTEAIDYINEKGVDLVLCDDKLKDMSGIRLAQIIRTNMARRPLPIIMVTLENRRDHVLDAISAGCIGYVLRPYVLETLERYLMLAQTLDTYPEIEELELQEAKAMVGRGDFDEAIEAFEEILTFQDEAQRYYDMGCDFLLAEKYGKAIVAFKKAVKINDLYAEAYKGLAEAYKGKGDENSYRENLKRAADVYAQFDRLEETKEIFIEILKHEADTPNPYNTLGVRLRKQGDYEGALHAYQQALQLSPDDENIYFNTAKAYHYMGNKDQSALYISTALHIENKFSEAHRLYQRITGETWTKTAPSAPRAPMQPGQAASRKSARDIG